VVQSCCTVHQAPDSQCSPVSQCNRPQTRSAVLFHSATGPQTRSAVLLHSATGPRLAVQSCCSVQQAPGSQCSPVARCNRPQTRSAVLLHSATATHLHRRLRCHYTDCSESPFSLLQEPGEQLADVTAGGRLPAPPEPTDLVSTGTLRHTDRSPCHKVTIFRPSVETFRMISGRSFRGNLAVCRRHECGVESAGVVSRV
jgi:hypothetical protein